MDILKVSAYLFVTITSLQPTTAIQGGLANNHSYWASSFALLHGIERAIATFR
jgi:hypothetical protein